jgi:hypothetical protein
MFYDISETEATGVRIVTPRVTNSDGSVTEEVRQEINLTLEFICCTPGTNVIKKFMSVI